MPGNNGNGNGNGGMYYMAHVKRKLPVAEKDTLCAVPTSQWETRHLCDLSLYLCGKVMRYTGVPKEEITIFGDPVPKEDAHSQLEEMAKQTYPQ